MSAIANALLEMLMRWVHISSATLLVGGVAYAAFVARDPAPEQRFRPWIYGAIAGLVVSGLYNLLSNPGHSHYYYTWFAVKALLALHVFASAILATSPAHGPRGARRLSSAAISGLLVIAVAAYLRRIF